MSKAPVNAQSSRPHRTRVPASRLLDPDNVGEQELTSHKKVTEHQQSRQHTRPTQDEPPAAASRKRQVIDLGDEDDGGSVNKRLRATPSSPPSSPSPSSPIDIPPPSEDIPSLSRSPSRHSSPLDMDRTGADGFLEDVQVQDLQPSTSRSKREDGGRDLNHFFFDAHEDGSKRRRTCKKCSKALVADVTTLRRHLEAHHKGLYREWCLKTRFKSKLPRDIADAKKAAAASTSQQLLTSHLVANPETPIFYSETTFRESALIWLVQTNQPVQAFDHPAFQNMIKIASRATQGVKLPNRNLTRDGLINMFKARLTSLRDRLLSSAVKGKISSTCDGWQASNVDAYFAVTAHWIEEQHKGIWTLEMGLIGFVQINNAHSGLRLGQVLYKIIARIGIQHKMGHITCDNASNNSTMLKTFEELMKKDQFKFDATTQHVRCLAHVNNLATQALLKTYSKSKHYDPTTPDTDLHISHDKEERDEVGLIRTISVKEHSSASRKQRFIEIQRRDQVSPQLHLKNDMPVVDTFVYELGRLEKDLTKRAKVDDLKLSTAEWKRVKLLLELLSLSDSAQQAFSSDQHSSLFLALPALEALHKAWSKRSELPEYASFRPALNAAVEKIEEYYDRTSETDAYTITMFLDPESKGKHMRKQWGENLYKQALARLELLYEDYYTQYSSDDSGATTTHVPHSSHRGLGSLLQELSSDDEDPGDKHGSGPSDSLKPWLPSFNKYIKAHDHLSSMSVVRWWGLNSERLPVWAAIARDYLPIMASSVSSERAFSAAGMTITKHRNRLKADIVEALQFLKWDTSRRDFFTSGPTVSAERTQDESQEVSGSAGAQTSMYEDTDDIAYADNGTDNIESILDIVPLDS